MKQFNICHTKNSNNVNYIVVFKELGFSDHQIVDLLGLPFSNRSVSKVYFNSPSNKLYYEHNDQEIMEIKQYFLAPHIDFINDNFDDVDQDLIHKMLLNNRGSTRAFINRFITKGSLNYINYYEVDNPNFKSSSEMKLVKMYGFLKDLVKNKNHIKINIKPNNGFDEEKYNDYLYFIERLKK